MHRQLPRGLVLAVACLSTATVVAEDNAACPGNPPTILLASKITDQAIELVGYRTIYIGFSGESYNSRSTQTVSLADVKIRDLAGAELTCQAAQERIKGETAILVTSGHEGISDTYKRLFHKDILVFCFPKQAPTWEPIQDPTRPVEGK